jgi:midasin
MSESIPMVSLGGVLLPRRNRPDMDSSTAASASSIAAAGTAATAATASSISESELIHVSSTDSHMCSIGLALCERRPVLLEGPSGSGKTGLIEECARICGQYSDMVRLHLDDQMDSKTLLGNYTCTDIPGEFRWIPGALTQAVIQGRWVLIEDIDRCPFEILSAIISLLERRTLFLAGRGETITAADGFQIFATKTVSAAAASGGSSAATEATPLLNALFSRVFIAALAYEELETILTHKLNPRHRSKKIIEQILHTFHAFVPLPGKPIPSDGSDNSSPFASTAALGSTRKYSTRDLLKWVQRIEIVLAAAGFDTTTHGSMTHLTSTMNEQIFLSAVEIFVAPIPPPVRALTAAAAAASTGTAAAAAAASTALIAVNAGPASPRALVISFLAGRWKVDADRAHFLTHMDKPRLTLNPASISVGRVTLNRFISNAAASSGVLPSNFAFTKYSLKMLEHMCMCVLLREPLLLVSATGVGKTTTIQFLAHLCGKKLHVQNLNQQSDSADLIGGYKPVEISKLMVPLMNSFGALFPRTFSRSQNEEFLSKLRKKYEEKAWNTLVKMMKQSVESAEKKLLTSNKTFDSSIDATTPRKQAKTASVAASPTGTSAPSSLLEQWRTFSGQLTHFSHQLSQLRSAFVFHFHEGSLVTALRNGDWILLDELNLASSETLERLSGILEAADSSLSLTERGDSSSLIRHPDFRLFGAMNPAQDGAGKKNLPPAIRARFTEMYVEEMTDKEDLILIVKQYIEPKSTGEVVHEPAASSGVISPIPYEGIVNFYLSARALSASGAIQEGANNSNAASSNTKPHYSLRTLCRALQFAREVEKNYSFSFSRALYEGFLVSFFTQLTPDSARKLEEILLNCLNIKKSSLSLDAPPKKPAAMLVEGIPHQLVGGSFYLPMGSELVTDALTAKFILTATVQSRLKQLARVLLTGKYPILLQGTTSAGKTSLVEYLALRTGHKFVRINNHEHTDLSEYMGSYVTDPRSGKLVFQEGVLVTAVRKGHWIVLDELNLAPSEVLEALNRLLDDNRELFLPETQEVIRPHPHFLLFATQNPAGGIYAGRKVLSAAFRNRFVTMHVDDLPENEVEEILHKRCALPPNYCKAMIGTMKELAKKREQSNVFAGKHSFMTPRDLFRWGERSPASYIQLAEDGYMLFGERLRSEEAKQIVKQVLIQQCKGVKEEHLNEHMLYSTAAVAKVLDALRESMQIGSDGPSSSSGAETESAIGKIAWTLNMRRLFVQVGRCLLFKEPVLAVGETGCGSQ